MAYVPSYNSLKGFEAKHSTSWIAKFSGNLSSLNVVNGYAPITDIDLKFHNAIEDSVTISPTGLSLHSIKGYERPSSISATFFEVDDLSVSKNLRNEIEKLDAFTKNRVLAYSNLKDFASDLIITVYKKDGSGIANTYTYSVIPKTAGDFSENQNFDLITFSVDFLVVGFQVQ